MRGKIATLAVSIALALAPGASAVTPVHDYNDDPGDGNATYIATWWQEGPDGTMFCWAVLFNGAILDSNCHYV